MNNPEALPRVVRAIDRLGCTGRSGRELAVRLDLTRSVGARHAWRRFRSSAGGGQTRARPGELEPAYRAIWRDAAGALGAEMVELPGSFIEFRTNGAWTRVWRHWVMLDDAVTLRYALQKARVHDRLRAHGLTVPEHLEFAASDIAAGREFLGRGPIPCVLKPVGNAGGSGVTSGVRTLANLLRARVRAWRIDERLLIERQVTGDNYRMLFLDGELLDVVRRRPPKVTGDGHSTIEQLVKAENARRLQREDEVLFWRLDIDLDCIFTLETLGLTVKSVPPDGTALAVKTVVNQNTADDNETVREPISEQLVDEARTAAQVIGVRLAGVDVITADLTKPLAASGGAILEVNGTPGLNYHYDVADRPNATHVAVPILRALLNERSRAALSARAAP